MVQTNLPIAYLNQKKSVQQGIKLMKDICHSLDQVAIVALTNQRGEIIHVNEKFCQISGYNRQELTGQDHRILNSGYHPASYFKSLWKTIANGKPWVGEFCNRAKDGHIYWVDSTIIPLLNKKNKPEQYLSIRFDITARKKLEEDLMATIERLNESQEVAHLGSWEVNLETNASQWSDETYRIFGMQPGDPRLSFEEWFRYMHPEDLSYVQKLMDESFKSKNDVSFSYRIIRKDGSIRCLYCLFKFKVNTEGKITGCFGTVHDITEKKKLEEQLQEQQKKQQLLITASTLEGQERERNALGRELHDNVNQILAGTKLYLSMIKENPAMLSEYIEFCINSLQQAVDENRRLAHGLVAPNFDDETFKEMIETVFRKMMSASGIEDDFDCGELQESLFSDELKLSLYRIIQEQCNNIIKYSKATYAHLRLRIQDGNIKLIISDNGKGVDLSKISRGIGLKNIEARISPFNGSMNVSSAPMKGFTLMVQVPIQKSRQQEQLSLF